MENRNETTIYTEMETKKRLDFWQCFVIGFITLIILAGEEATGQFEGISNTLLGITFMISAVISCYLSLWLAPKKFTARGGYDIILKVYFQYRFGYPAMAVMFIFPIVLSFLCAIFNINK